MPDYRASWYSQLPSFGWFDPSDRPGSNALGVPDTQQGIALPSRRTLGQWFNVTAPSGQTLRLQQTDVGPAPWTGRGVDISAAAGNQFGYTPNTFPTNASFRVEPTAGGAPLAAQGNRSMPGLMDLFGTNPTALGVTGDPLDFNTAVNQRSGSLIGLGLGLMGGGFLGGMKGFEAGATADARARQAALAQRHQLFQEQQANITPFQRMQADIARYKGTPAQSDVEAFYAPQLGTQTQVVTIRDPNDPEQQMSALYHPRAPAGQQLTDLNGRPIGGGAGVPAVAFGAAPAPGARGGVYGGALPGVGGLPTPPQTAVAPSGRAALPPGPTAPGLPSWLGPGLAGGVAGPAGATSYADMPARVGAKAFQHEQELRKEFESVNKSFFDTRDAYGRMLNAEATGPGDVAMLYAYIKMINPNARINPGQAADAENTAGVPEVIRNLWNRVIKGDRLSPAHRQELLNNAGGIYGAREVDYNQLADQYRGIARQNRIAPERVIPNLGRPTGRGEGAPGGTPIPFTDDEIDAELRRRQQGR